MKENRTGRNILFVAAVVVLCSALIILFLIHRTKQSSVEKLREQAATAESPIELAPRGEVQSVVEEVVSEVASVGPEDLSAASAGDLVVAEPSSQEGEQEGEQEGAPVVLEEAPTTEEGAPIIEEGAPLVEEGVEVVSSAK